MLRNLVDLPAYIVNSFLAELLIFFRSTGNGCQWPQHHTQNKASGYAVNGLVVDDIPAEIINLAGGHVVDHISKTFLDTFNHARYRHTVHDGSQYLTCRNFLGQEVE